MPDEKEIHPAAIRRVCGKVGISLWAAIGILITVSVAAYANTLQNGFVYDDNFELIGNRWIRDIRFIPDIFMQNAWGFQSSNVVSNYYRPMMQLIYMLAYHILGLEPWGFHLLSILFHAGVSVMVFFISRKLILSHGSTISATQEGTPLGYKRMDHALLPAFAGSLLFAAHPVHTEAVAWVAALSELSYSFFCLVSLYFFMGSDERGRAWYWMSVIAFSIAALSKESALMLLPIFAFYDFTFNRSFLAAPAWRKAMLRRYVPYLCVAATYLVLRLYALGNLLPHESSVKLSAYGYLINVFPLFAGYMEKLLLPFNLNAYYVLHPISSLFDIRGIVSFAVTSAFLVIVCIAFKRNRLIFFSLILMTLPLLPSLYIPAFDENVFAERYLYLPSFGFILLIAEGLSWIRTEKTALVSGVGIAVVLVTAFYSVETRNRNRIWKDDVTLYTDMISKSPDSAKMHLNLGFKYYHKGCYNDAISHYRIASNLRPELAEPHNNTGLIYEDMNLIDEAIGEYKIALKLKADYPEAHNNLGNALMRMNRLDEAIDEFGTALKIMPNFTAAHYNRGNAYARRGLLDEAVSEYKSAIRLDYDDPDVHTNLANVYYRQNRFDEAARESSIALKLNDLMMSRMKQSIRH